MIVWRRLLAYLAALAALAASNAASSGSASQPPDARYRGKLTIPYLQLPLDSQGFAASFDLNDTVAWRAFFDTYGLVVLRDVLSEQECKATVDEMWESLAPLGLRQHDPRSWERVPWGGHMGFLGNHAIFTPAACQNRQSVRLYDAFRTLYGTDHMVVSVDRLGFMRATQGLLTPDGQRIDREEWASLRNWLHWDMNPFTGSTSVYSYQGNSGPPNQHNKGFGKLKTQGIVALDDADVATGGFHCVPGFHKWIQAWGHAHPHLRATSTYPVIDDETTMQVPYSDPIRAHIQPVPLRRGSLLIWHSAIPHGTFPNHSNRSRLVQYLKMADAHDPAVIPAARSTCKQCSNTVVNFGPWFLPTASRGFKLTHLGERLYAFKEWAANDTRDSVLALDGVALPPLGGNGQGGTLQELDVLADGGTGAGADTRPLP